MTKTEAQKILKRIEMDPGIADQFTEKELEEILYIASNKKA